MVSRKISLQPRQEIKLGGTCCLWLSIGIVTEKYSDGKGKCQERSGGFGAMCADEL